MILHVHPTRYRQGIGRALVVAVAEQLQQRGSTSMMLWTREESRAHGFYRRLGGRLLNARQVSGTGAAEVAYRWPEIGSLCVR